MTEKEKKAVIALIELATTAIGSSSFDDLYDYKDRSLEDAVKDILEAISG